MSTTEKKFYEEARDAIKDFAQYAVDSIKGQGNFEHSAVKGQIEAIRALGLTDADLENLQKIIEDSVTGAVHSIFVTIDGGTALSDEGKALDLIDAKTGKPLTEGALHENFMDALE